MWERWKIYSTVAKGGAASIVYADTNSVKQFLLLRRSSWTKMPWCSNETLRAEDSN